MYSASILCPICTHCSFENIDSLRISLITAANGPVSCPQCNEIFMGLDKFTIHLFSHSSSINDIYEDQKNARCNQLDTTTVSETSPLSVNIIEQDMNSTTPEIVDQNSLSALNKSENKKPHIAKNCWDNKLTAKYMPNKVDLHQLISRKVEKRICSSILTIPKMKSGQNERYGCTSEFQCAEDTSINWIASTGNDKVNESAKLWGCDICTKSFTTKYFLKKHKRLHTGEMPYRCGICDRTFTFQQSYHKHILYHSDEKPHVCQTCHRAFKELSTLHNHERIHSGEKPFKCEICDKLADPPDFALGHKLF